MKIRATIAAIAALATCVAAPSFAADEDKIDLKLFGKQEVGPPQGCSVLLWQANRDPDKDRYAYVFHEKLSPDHARQPATIRIGGNPIEFRRVAAGGREKGFKLFEQQLYRSVTGDYSAILDLRLGDNTGEAVEIAGGSVTVATPGKLPFRVSVKGGAGCMTAAVPAPAPQAGAPADGMFQRYEVKPNLIPRALLADAQKKFQCNPEIMRSGIKAFQLSEESGLWEIPCDRFAYQASSVFANVHVERPAEYTFVGFAAPPGRKREEPFTLLNATWNERARTLTGIAMGRGMGDCGTYEVHRVAEARFRLIEFREKKECDGKAGPPEQWPLVFRAR